MVFFIISDYFGPVSNDIAGATAPCKALLLFALTLSKLLEVGLKVAFGNDEDRSGAAGPVSGQG